jgi:DNA-binding HxlR family transcriptional regulator
VADVRWTDIGDTRCSVARALSVVGDRWTILLLREAFLGTRRFEDFQANTGASRALVADRLKDLVEEGVLDRVPYQERPERFEYRLTEKGVDLYPVVTALLTWGDRWNPSPAGPPMILVHQACGHAMHPQLTCPDCGEPLTARDVRATATGPLV